MFWNKRAKAAETLYIVVKEQHGLFEMAMGKASKTYRNLRAAELEAERMAGKMNDGRYYVFQAVAVSEVVTPSAVTRPIGTLQLERETVTSS